MKNLLRKLISIASSFAAVGSIAFLAHCVSDSAAPVVALDGGTLVGEASVVQSRFSVAGTVDGLPATATVTLTLNGASSLTVKNGAFVFPAVLADGQAYEVDATAATQGFSCAAKNGTGTASNANVTGVVVHCSSGDATLSSLTLSTGMLSPAFMSATLAYTATVRVPALFSSVAFPPTTVTATPNDPGATIEVNGVAAPAAKPSAPIAIKGATPIDVLVTASDGKSQKHYAVVASGLVSDYVKASNTLDHTNFGWSVALSGDGNTLAVGSITEKSNATGINGDEMNTLGAGSGAVYVYRRTGSIWTKEAYVKASNKGGFFGYSVSLSTDGNTLAVGADGENSNATGVGGDQTDMSAGSAGAAYVFTRSGTTWSQQAYIKASNTRGAAFFGAALAISGDGSTLAVGSYGESSASKGVQSVQTDTSAPSAGAVYVFTHSGATWSQQAYVKASNTQANESFGSSIALSSDGNTMAVGASGDPSGATTINGNDADTSAPASGAVFVFTRAATTWTQQAYVKASNNRTNAGFGPVALSSDGNTLAVSAAAESSAATTINGNASDTSAPYTGAGYIFKRAVTTWSQDTYLKASTISFAMGASISLSGDGNTLVLGAPNDSSNATGINGDPSAGSATNSGAAYVFAHGTAWTQLAYVKPSNTRMTTPALQFGQSIALSRDGLTLLVGATGEDSGARGINGNEAADAMFQKAGAAYVY